MKKPLDRITEAYYDDLGTKFGKKVRKRIHWVCEKVKGENVLDIGCSQGIVPILLGREGKKVLGLDLLQESIDFANESLSNEAEITQKFVEFKVANFMHYDFGEEKYSTVILGEVLEHITDPKRFLNKAAKLLEEDGTVVITVPFGINDYFDHKKTYYLIDLLDLVDDELYIQEIEFFGKWIGLVIRNCKERKEQITFNKDLVKKVEESFFQIERELVDELCAKKNIIKSIEKDKEQITKLEKELNEVNTAKENEIKRLEEIIENSNKNTTTVDEISKKLSNVIEKKQKELELANSSIIEEKSKVVGLIGKVADKDNQIESLSQQLAQCKKQIKSFEKTDISETENIDSKQLSSYIKEIHYLKNKLIESDKEKVKIKEDLLKAYNNEERLLKSHRQLVKRYQSLSESKLGRLTLTYWTWRRKQRGANK